MADRRWRRPRRPASRARAPPPTSVGQAPSRTAAAGTAAARRTSSAWKADDRTDLDERRLAHDAARRGGGSPPRPRASGARWAGWARREIEPLGQEHEACRGSRAGSATSSSRTSSQSWPAAGWRVEQVVEVLELSLVAADRCSGEADVVARALAARRGRRRAGSARRRARSPARAPRRRGQRAAARRSRHGAAAASAAASASASADERRAWPRGCRRPVPLVPGEEVVGCGGARSRRGGPPASSRRRPALWATITIPIAQRRRAACQAQPASTRSSAASAGRGVLAHVVAARGAPERVGGARERRQVASARVAAVLEAGAGEVAHAPARRRRSGAPTPPRRRGRTASRRTRPDRANGSAPDAMFAPQTNWQSRSAGPRSSVVIGAGSRPQRAGRRPPARARIGPPKTSRPGARRAPASIAASQPGGGARCRRR